jgi:hypothetical protein
MSRASRSNDRPIRWQIALLFTLAIDPWGLANALPVARQLVRAEESAGDTFSP